MGVVEVAASLDHSTVQLSDKAEAKRVVDIRHPLINFLAVYGRSFS